MEFPQSSFLAVDLTSYWLGKQVPSKIVTITFIMPGYSKLICKNKIEEKYLCTKCELILRDAVQTYCGHRYCRSCVDIILSKPGTHTCLVCGEGDAESIIVSDQIFADNAIKRELRSLSVKCPNEGCLWKGKFQDYEVHYEMCDWQLIQCMKKGCDKMVVRSNLASHLENECMMRIVLCQYCKEEMIFKDLEEHHLNECLRYPVKCQYCGRANLSRETLREHQDPTNGDCEKKLLPCSYKVIGCNAQMQAGDLISHLETGILDHQEYLLQAYLKIHGFVEDSKKDKKAMQQLFAKFEAQEKELDKISKRCMKLEKDIANMLKHGDQGGATHDKSVDAKREKQQRLIEELKNKVTVLDTKFATYEGIIAVLNGQIERDANVVQAMERERKQDRDLVESLERKIKSQDRIIALKDVALAEQDLRIQSLELASYDGVLVWKITDFNRKRNDALSGRTTSIYSPCFFTSCHGYKMCARVYLNGDGMGKGNHVSLFFVIMRGSFDGLLRWPFRQKVTFMLLDQNNREHVIDAFRPDPTSNSFKKPTGDMNIASGCPLFMPLGQLESSRHAYVKDDCLFIKVIVDTTDIS
ncbi:LOW QUALITY PROTEIN: TNF receptor-associated factor 2-like [Saccoglossus kowalevskii]